MKVGITSPTVSPSLYRLVAVAAILSLALAACSGTQSTGSAPASDAATAAPASQPGASAAGAETLRIGMATGLSGSFEPWGSQFHDSLELCAKMVNNGTLSKYSSIVSPDGGATVGGKQYNFEIVPYDTENDVAKSVAGISKLVLQDQVDYIIGPVGETEAFTTGAPVINDNKVLNLQLNTLWQAQGPQWPYSINIMTDMEDYYQGTYKWLIEEHPEVKRVAIITTDQTYGRIGAIAALKAARDTGAIQIVYEAYVPFDTADYNAVVTGALAANPDVIDIGGAANPNAFTGILTAAHQQGFEGTPPADGSTPIKFMATSWNPELVLANVPAEYFEGVVQSYPTASWGPDGPTEEAAWLYEQMLVEYGADSAAAWNTVTPGGYYACRVFLEGLKAADSVDPTAIASALTSLEVVDTPMGPAGWTGQEMAGVNHRLGLPVRVLQVQNGKNVVVGTYEAPFSWDYNWAGLPGAEQFQPNQ